MTFFKPSPNSVRKIKLSKGTIIKLHTEDGEIIESKAESDIEFKYSELKVQKDIDSYRNEYFYLYTVPYPIKNSKNIIKLEWSSESWSGVSLPLVRKVFGTLSAQQIVSVQPMSLPTGLTFYTNFQYGTNIPAPEQPPWGIDDVWR